MSNIVQFAQDAVLSFGTGEKNIGQIGRNSRLFPAFRLLGKGKGKKVFVQIYRISPCSKYGHSCG